MSKSIRGILIDPHSKTISVVPIEHSAAYRGICTLIDAPLICTVNLNGPNRETLFLDDEGLFEEGQEFFALGEYPYPLAGKGLILGTDEEGESVSSQFDVRLLVTAVRWLSAQEAADMGNAQADAVRAAVETANAEGPANFFHIANAPSMEVDQDTGKARAA